MITFETSGGSFEVCQGIRFTITGYANGGTGEYSDYTWTAAPGMIFSTTFDDVVVFNTDYFTAPGSYEINLTVTDTEGNTGTGSITIQLKKTDRVTISTGDATTFCAPGSALLVADPADGFSYQWRLNLVNIPGAEAFSYEATQSGSYRVRMTSENGCSHTSSDIVIQTNEPPQVTASNDGPVCEGNDLQLTGGPDGAASYLWSHETDTDFSSTLQNPLLSSVTAAQAGNYTLFVEDADGCSNTATTQVIVHNAPVAPLSAEADMNSICQGTEGNITLSATGGSGQTLNWYTGSCQETLIGQGTPLVIPSPQTTTTYYASWESESCGSSECVSVTVTVNPTPVAMIQTTDISCFGASDGTASVTISDGTSPYSIVWSNGSDQLTAENLDAGIHSVTVTDSNGCVATAQDTIAEPELLVVNIAEHVNVSCYELQDGLLTVEATGGTTPYTFEWSHGVTGPTAAELAAGLYQVQVTDASGCTAELEIEITQPDPIVIQITEITHIDCFSDDIGTATVEASEGLAPYTYAWSNGQTGPTAENLGAGTYLVTATDANGCSQSLEVTINGFSEIVPEITDQQNLLCFGDSTGTATVEVSGGSPGYSFLWSNGQTSHIATGLPAGEHTVQITDAAGCTATATVEILSPEELIISVVDSQDAGCPGGNDAWVTVAATGGTPGYSYLWDDGQTGETASGLAAGEYVVEATDNNGCLARDTVTVAEPEPITITFTDIITTSCTGTSDGGATAVAQGGTPGYTFAWDDGQTGETAVNLAVGSYTVTVTDANGCEQTSQVDIESTNELLVVSAGDDIQACDPANSAGVQLQLQISGGSDTLQSVEWSPALGLDDHTIPNPTASPAVTTTYTVTITDTQGCVATDEIIVEVLPELFADAGDDITTCYGIPVVLGGQPAAWGGTGSDYTYQWTPSEGLLDPEAANPMAFSPSDTTTYTLTVTNSDGCVATDEMTLNVTPQIIVDAGLDQNVCAGSEVTLGGDPTASGGQPPYLHYWWIHPNQPVSTSPNPVVQINQDTEYHLTVSDMYGCFSGAKVMITANEPVNIDAGEDQMICQGQSTTLMATGGTSYLWDTGETTASVEVAPQQTTTYSVTASSACGQQTDSVTVEVEEPLLMDLGPDMKICEGDTLLIGLENAPTGYTYSWESNPAGLTSDQPTVLVNPSSTTTYTLTAESINGCISQATVNVVVHATPRPQVIDDLLFCSKWHVEPVYLGADPVEGYSYEWSSSPEGFTSESSNPMAFIGDETTITYFVQVTSEEGCSGFDTVTVSVSDFLISSTDPVSICSDVQQLSIADYAEVTGGTPPYTYKWMNPQGDVISEESHPVIAAPFEAFYQLAVQDASGCLLTHNIPVSVIPEPAAVLQANPEGTAFIGQTVTYTAIPEGYHTYEFRVNGTMVQTGSSNTYATNDLKNGQEVSVVITNLGCSYTTNIVVSKVNGLPTAFTPDGDGINDVFGIGYDLIIFNRWGQKVHQGTQGWDGRNDGRYVSAGTYYYIMNMVNENNREVTLKGSVTVIR
ncbi:MAG: gliding motility-associated C-terminal domain-containing protein [Bacteroidales bacterium]